jgi:hypothetical protein
MHTCQRRGSTRHVCIATMVPAPALTWQRLASYTEKHLSFRHTPSTTQVTGWGPGHACSTGRLHTCGVGARLLKKLSCYAGTGPLKGSEASCQAAAMTCRIQAAEL